MEAVDWRRLLDLSGGEMEEEQMMFSSNQVFEISGSLNQLEAAIDFAMEYSGHKECFIRKEKPAKCVYQVTRDGRYCIGWNFGGVEEGWIEYPFDYDAKIIAQIASQHIQKAEKPFNEFDGYDGSSRVGFLLQEGPGGKTYKERDCVKNGFFCIVNIRPFWCFYAK